MRPVLPSAKLGLGAPRHLCSPGSALSPRANAPLLHDEAFALLVAQIELLPRDGFGRLSIRGLDDSEKFAALADYGYPPDTERQGRPRAGCLHLEEFLEGAFGAFRNDDGVSLEEFLDGAFGASEMTMVTL